ncbi:hypothetical protein ONZ45_g4152 [Pleurotus djamor]|nr:hypothetical protein ONZ45_g4152 [Pleurotus djamor]
MNGSLILFYLIRFHPPLNRRYYPERFKRAALQPLPLGDPSRPTPALLSAVYLIGQAISRHDGGSEQETTYLTSTLQLISTALLGDHPLRIMHRLQAGVLLANYFFRNGRLLEARHHASSVCTLAVACGLHRMELIANTLESAPVHHGEDTVQPILEPASDRTELGERISAFWTVFTLHNFWSAALGAPISFAFDVTLPVNVPWGIVADNPEPLENVQWRNMVHNLLVNGEDGGPSGLTIPALLSKAALLYQRSAAIAFDYLSGSQTNPSEMTAEIHTLDLLAENIRAHLPTLGQIRNTNFSLSRLVVVAHALANATVIKLHSLFMQPNAWSRQRCLTAAEILIHFSNDPIILELRVINPIMASLWPLACQVILDEIARLRTARELSLLPDVSEREVQLGRIIETAISVMGAFAQDSPYMGMELTKVQIAYASIAP